MHKELLTTSPLLGLSVVALFLFLAVFLVVTARALMQSRAEVDEAARLPLGEDESPRERGTRHVG